MNTVVSLNGKTREPMAEYGLLNSNPLGYMRWHLECQRHPNEKAVALLNALIAVVDAENALRWRLTELRSHQ